MIRQLLTSILLAAAVCLSVVLGLICLVLGWSVDGKPFGRRQLECHP